MKKLFVSVLTVSILLAGCGLNKEEQAETKLKKEESKTTENKEVKKKNVKEKTTSEKRTTESPTTEVTTTETVTTEVATSELVTSELAQVQNSKINPADVQSQQQLETIIYSNQYTEREKTLAYQYAVDKGIIPMAPATELYAAERYRDSVNMQNGMSEKDIMRQKYESWIDAGMFTEEQMEEELAKFDY